MKPIKSPKFYMTKSFQALLVRKNQGRIFTHCIENRLIDDLPKNDILIRVHFSSVNFKDYMSCEGHPAITRKFPHTPGIDASGIVEESNSSDFCKGDRVIVISYAMGISIPGGFGQYISVPAIWVMKLDDNMSLEESMAFGTAGYTAALSIDAIQKNTINNNAKINNTHVIISGATGGIGCIAIAILNQLGYIVTAITGSPEVKDTLTEIGAKKVILRSELEVKSKQNLLTPKWNAAIDVAGGELLSNLIKMIKDNGIVTATGMINNTHFDANVLPFILRGITLTGINAENTSMECRKNIWKKMATIWKPKNLNKLYHTIDLQDLPEYINKGNQNKAFGRTVIDMR